MNGMGVYCWLKRKHETERRERYVSESDSFGPGFCTVSVKILGGESGSLPVGLRLSTFVDESLAICSASNKPR